MNQPVEPNLPKSARPPFFGINPIIRLMIISDFIIMSGFGLVAPIFAVFILDNISGGNLAVIGLAQAFYYIARSGFQLPIAWLIDRKKGEKDDFWVMFIGSLLFSVMPLCYLLVSTPLELYLVQFIYGLGSALAIPTWAAIFSRHLDRGKEGTEWAVHNLFFDLAIALAAATGGFIAYQYGFDLLFVLVSLFSLTGSLVLIWLRHDLEA